jgi:ribosomal protein S18 acetylase RimI-like enzyme
VNDALTFRDARPVDAPDIEALWNAAYGQTSRSGVQDIPAFLAHGPAARLLLAEVDGAIAGTLIATYDGWRGNMYRLAVHPRFQRRGIARRLVQEAHAWLRELGCKRITALVEGDHDWAISFWESCGYEHDVAMRRYHLDVGKQED